MLYWTWLYLTNRVRFWDFMLQSSVLDEKISKFLSREAPIKEAYLKYDKVKDTCWFVIELGANNGSLMVALDQNGNAGSSYESDYWALHGVYPSGANLVIINNMIDEFFNDRG